MELYQRMKEILNAVKDSNGNGPGNNLYDPASSSGSPASKQKADGPITTPRKNKLPKKAWKFEYERWRREVATFVHDRDPEFKTRNVARTGENPGAGES